MHFRGIWKLLPIAFFSSVASAGDLHFGGYLKAGKYSVDDPDGDSETADNVVPAVRILYDLDARGQRLFGGAEYVAFSLDPEPDSIAQDVDGYTLLGGYERKIPVSRSVKIWLSGAIGMSSVEFSNRSAIANDGYLEHRLEDRTENYVSGSLGIDTYFAIADHWEIGVGLFVDVPMGDGVNAAGLKVTLQQF